jgi:hypothetical protein
MVETSNTTSKAKFDVIGFARNVLAEIENIRSYRKVQDDNTKEDFGLPVESRLNAFFRLVGLPMFVTAKSKDESNSQNTGLKGNLHLTPGYDKSISPFLKNYNIEKKMWIKEWVIWQPNRICGFVV